LLRNKETIKESPPHWQNQKEKAQVQTQAQAQAQAQAPPKLYQSSY
jgi:hypothetical protein